MAVDQVLERRTHPRHDVEVPSRYWIEGPDAAVICQLIDISAGGVCIGVSDWSRLDLETYATIELPIPGEPRTLPAFVEVKGIGGDEHPVVRMCFVDTSPGFRRRIARAAQSWASGGPG